MSGDEGQILDAFIDTMWIEIGLSQNTLNSYKRDTVKYFLLSFKCSSFNVSNFGCSYFLL